MKSLDDKIIEQKDFIRSQEAGLQELEAIKGRTDKTSGIDQWLDFPFTSSSGLTEEFAQFNRDFKKAIKSKLPENCEIAAWSRGHFECTAFILNRSSGKYVYVSISDVRFFPNTWHNDILVRTAEHIKDYTGGGNYSANMDNLTDKIKDLS